MEVFSHYGVGIKPFAIERKSDGRVEFTLWITMFWFPVFPQSAWSAYYAGPAQPDGIYEVGHCFTDALKIRRGLVSYINTVSNSILVLALAVAPAGYLIFRTTGRAASSLEMILVFASCVWPVVVITLMENRRIKLLKGNER